MITNSQKTFVSPLHQTRRLFELYTYYRVALIIALWIIDTSEYTKDLTGTLNPVLYTSTLFCYGFYQGLLLFLLRDTHFPHKIAIFVNALIDISALSLLTFASGGVSSGMGGLLVAAVAACNVLLAGRIGIFLAAYGTLSILFIEIYLGLQANETTKGLFQGGILGALYFFVALFIQHLAKRAHQSEQVAQQQALDLADLEELNHLIIQRLRMGIIVIDDQLRIRTMNEMARAALGGYPLTIPDVLKESLMRWRAEPHERPAIFRLSDNLPEIQPNFASLTFASHDHVIIFLEDNAQLTKQAQQLKLASLGRLTASIAHEIRNPLGAISHAAQLLDESTHLDKSDRHLLEMIKKHAVRMNGIIENILALSRQSTPHPDTFELNDWLRQFVQEYRSSYQDTAIELEVAELDISIHMDRSQLNQILINLCDNGLRYSKMHTGHATLLIRTGIVKENDRPYLDVIDNGAGVAEEHQQHLFEPFYTTETSGNGLGLYICKGLCELNQASLDYVTQPGGVAQPGGACFRLIFAHPQRIIN
jgi:two-component system sensor histidine kinase PilS (NtrC family)